MTDENEIEVEVVPEDPPVKDNIYTWAGDDLDQQRRSFVFEHLAQGTIAGEVAPDTLVSLMAGAEEWIKTGKTKQAASHLKAVK